MTVKNFEEFNKLNESPDKIKIGSKKYSYRGKKSYPFEVYYNEITDKIDDVEIGKESTTHDDNIFNKKPQCTNIFPGRIYVEQKIITFWTYPSASDFLDIVSILESKLKIKINNKWFVEVYQDESGKPIEQGYKSYYCEYDRYGSSIFVPIDEYIKSKDAPSAEYEEHKKSPILKKKKNVPLGIGSNRLNKKPLYLKQAMYAESILKIENI